MFSELREKISHATAGVTIPAPQKVARTFFLLVSPSMFNIKEWFQGRFPISDRETARLYPWLLMREGDDFQREVGESVKGAFDSNRVSEITLKGISILDSCNQVIVVADLSEPDACDRLVKGCEMIKSVIGQITDPKTPLYWIGILTLRRPETEEKESGTGHRQEETSEILSASPETLKQVSQDLFQTLFHRVFLLDVSNPQGAFVSKVEDQHCLVGHLLYFLTTYPLSAESVDQYAQWLVSTPEEGSVSSFSALSFVLPIDQILETVTVLKGAEFMTDALLSDQSLNRASFYVNNFLQKNSLLQIGEVKKMVSDDPDLPLRDPASCFPDFSSMRPEDYLETMNSLDSSLPTIADDNEAIMERVGEKRFREWQEAMEDHLEAIVTEEMGGLRVAKRFLQELAKHLEGIQVKELRPPQYSDPGPSISALQRLIQDGPRKEAIFGRSLVLAAVSVVAVAFFPLAGITKILSLIGLPVLCFGLGAFASYSARQELQNEVLRLQKLVREKWSALLESGRLKAAEKRLEDLLASVKSLEKEIESACKRVEEVAGYFKNKYIPPFPQEFAFWRYVLKEREKLIQYQSLCKVDAQAVAKDYIGKDRPLFLRRRLSSPGTPDPNEWEQHMVEMAAIRLLPGCSDIVNLNILSCIENGEEGLESYKMAMIRGAQPFLNLRPGTEVPELRAILETEPQERHPVVKELVARLSGYFRDISQKKPRSPYRISLFGFLEGVKIDNIFMR